MNKQDAEKIVAEYLKPIFSFALKRCKNEQDAEDLSQEIMLRSYRALLVKDDIADAGKFIRTVAHHTLCNYYRDSLKTIVGVSLDEMAESISDPDALEQYDDTDTVRRLQNEIAYLSYLQRKIVIAYYFENRKQTEISKALNIPVGTVKWHLFEAKKELKRGMDTMRKTSELKFNPIRFHSIGINGSAGKRPANEYLRSSLAQNICYCVRSAAKTVSEIADDLGVSPVYVESELESLEDYGLLTETKGRYLANFIISEPTVELLTMQDKMYKEMAALFADALYDELCQSGILDDPRIVCHQTDGEITLTESPRADRNFILWALIPYIAACSGERLADNTISFKEVATIRPDGARNIVHAAVFDRSSELPSDYVYMKDWCGPMWGWDDRYHHLTWKIESEWSEKGERPSSMHAEETVKLISLYEREKEMAYLSKDEYAWLAERGYVKVCGEIDGSFKSSWQIVILENTEIKNELLAIGETIKAKHRDMLEAIKAPYIEAELNAVAPHLRKIKAYELQFIGHSDGWFLCHCIHRLLKNGKLQVPTEGQRKALSTLIVAR